MPNNYVLLDRIELNNTAASVTFDNIPQSGYTDLKVVVSGRSARTGTNADNLNITFNGSTSGYSGRVLYGDGSGAGSYTPATTYILGEIPTANTTANTFGNAEFYIPNYRSSNFKSVSLDSVTENNASGAGSAYADLIAGLWSNTAAITSIRVASQVANFVAGSTFSLYGIAQVGTTPAIAPKADGGNVIGTDGTYWYHAFLSNGTFTPQVGLSADVLVVAGGGGGGGDVSGGLGAGGGAGGLLLHSSQSLANATNYTCTVGAGGATGSSATGTNGANGINSSFGALTASVGGGGGGGAGASFRVGQNGGSGGGGGASSSSGGSAGGTATSGQGNNGSAGSTGGAGGGGGAGAAGGATSTNTGGAGGAGLNTYSSWATATGTGVSGFYAGGGGGWGSVTQGAAGSGGGGAASGSTSTANAVVNTGGGGGAYVGAGGSGIVIIRYPVA